MNRLYPSAVAAKRLVFALVPLAAGLLAGCDGSGPTYRNDAAAVMNNALTPRTSWRAGGDVTGAGYAIDGQVDTAAVSEGDYTGRFILLDLGRPCIFQTVTINHGPNDLGYAAGVEVATSNDGRNFRVNYATFGTRGVTIISLPRPALARYVRLRALQTGPQPWSLAEIYLQ